MTAFPTRIVDSQGAPVFIAQELGRGGEGAVFAVRGAPHLAAKLYFSNKGPPAEKLLAMAIVGRAHPSLVKVAAWPTDILKDAQTNIPVGFLMPLLHEAFLIQSLYNPIQRLKYFPRAGWSFQARVARNLAAAFEEVHKARCIIGDVNQSNVLVSARDATIKLIDCDSFQINSPERQYASGEVGVVHYLPPELQGKNLKGLVRTENHDRFGLAVLIYQLLFVGRHPYAGIFSGAGDPTTEDLIAQFRFAQGPLAHTWQMAPPPHVPTLSCISPDLGMLLRRAFERGSEKNCRPSAAEWITKLDGFGKQLQVCSADDGHQYWSGAGSCSWCRIEAKGGPEYFFGVSSTTAGFAVDESRLQQIMAQLRDVSQQQFSYRREAFVPSVRPAPTPLDPAIETDSREHATFTALLTLAVAICGVLVFGAFWEPVVGAIGAFGAVAFGTGGFIHHQQSPRVRERKRRKRRLAEARGHLVQVEGQINEYCRTYHNLVSHNRASVERLVADIRHLKVRYDSELVRLEDGAKAAAFTRHLRLHSISDAVIPGIGEGLKRQLAAHLIYSAAEVDERRVRSIHGFGPQRTAALILWRHQVAGVFAFDATKAVSPSDAKSTVAKYRNIQKDLVSQADTQISKIREASKNAAMSLNALAPTVRQALLLFEQTHADYQLVS